MYSSHVARSPLHWLRAPAIVSAVALATGTLVGCEQSTSTAEAADLTNRGADFHLVEARIADIHAAILAKDLTATELVELYLARIKAYNGACVRSRKEFSGRSRRSRTPARSTRCKR